VPGVPGVPAADVVVLGGGVSGTHAATIAVGMGAHVTVVDRSTEMLKRLATQFGASIHTRFSTRSAIAELVKDADLLIGTVLSPGAAAPKLVTAGMVRTTKPGSVIVDAAIDQGGCVETSRAATHAEPTDAVDGVGHYWVANMPWRGGARLHLRARQRDAALASQPRRQGLAPAPRDDPHLRNGLNVCDGHVTCKPVAETHGMDFTPGERMLA
jgi:alanine dehydrogenase